MVAREPRVADLPVELFSVERAAMLVVEADANGVGTSVLDESVGNGLAFDDGGGVGGDLLRGEAQAGGDRWIDTKRGRGTADGILDAVKDIDDSRLSLDGGCDLVTDLRQQSGIVIEEFDLNRLR